MAQTTTRAVTLSSIMTTRMFQSGCLDIVFGNPWPKEYDQWGKREQWNYERGRLFMVACNMPSKDGNRVRLEAIRAYIAECKSGGLI